MVNRLVLHIGTHKTGTTSIQASLADAYDHLLQHGVLYPRTGRGRFSGHPNYAWRILGRDRYRPDVGGIEELMAEVEQTRPASVVISSEALSDRPRDPALAQFGRDLGHRLGVAHVDVVAYVRPQSSYMESHYIQLIKGGNSSQTLQQHVESYLDHPRFDYLQVFEHWFATFGEDLRIRPYTIDVVSDFWDAVEILPAPLSRRPVRRNVRVGRRAVEMLRLLRGRLQASGLRSGPDLRRAVSTAADEVAQAFPQDEPYHGLTPELDALIRGHFQATNEEFARTVAGTDPSQLFSSPTDVTPSVWRYEEATPQEREFFDDLVRRSLSSTEHAQSEESRDPYQNR